MIKTHTNALTAKLEEVIDRGVSHILWKELYRWYDAQRIAVNTWRDIGERWEDLSDPELHGELFKIEGAGGIFLFARKTAELIPAPVKPFSLE